MTTEEMVDLLMTMERFDSRHIIGANPGPQQSTALWEAMEECARRGRRFVKSKTPYEHHIGTVDRCARRISTRRRAAARILDRQLVEVVRLSSELSDSASPERKRLEFERQRLDSIRFSRTR